MKHSNSNNCIFCRYPFLKKALVILAILWGSVFASSLLYYFFGNAKQRTYWYIFNSSLYYITIPVFCYALLSFIAERGLFNGIRYSVKQFRSRYFKKYQTELMTQYSVNTPSELSAILKEKYLYTSPYSELTLPLLISGGISFLLLFLFSLL